MSVVDCFRYRRPEANFHTWCITINDIVIHEGDGGGYNNQRSVTIVVAAGQDINDNDVASGEPVLLALPPQTPKQIVDRIKLHAHKPIIAVFDMGWAGVERTNTSDTASVGMVHALFLGQFLFMIFTEMLWTQEYEAPDENRLARPPKKARGAPEIIQCKEQYSQKSVVRAHVLTGGGVDVDEDNQLCISDIDAYNLLHGGGGEGALFCNNTAKLLMPHNLTTEMRVKLANGSGGEFSSTTPVIFDQYGRVLYTLINNCTHLITMPLWMQTALDRTVTAITGISRADPGAGELDSLKTPYRLGGELLFLPKLPPEFHAQWQPNGQGGDYMIWYTRDNQAMYIARKKSPEEMGVGDIDAIEEDYGDDLVALREHDQLETDIDLRQWWDTRYTLVGGL